MFNLRALVARHRNSRRLFAATVVLVAAVAILSTRATAQSTWRDKVDARLLDLSMAGEVEFLVVLDEQADLTRAARIEDKIAKGQFVYRELSAVALRSQKPLVAQLAANDVPHRSYWVQNMIWVRGNREWLIRLARRTDVAQIHSNPWVRHEQVDISDGADQLLGATGVEWNILQINAPAVWNAGFYGQGAVIGGQDTGYEWQHPALKEQYRGWTGESADHTYSWHDAIHGEQSGSPAGNACGYDLLEPCDDHGHGTHTMGTMVGDDGAGNQIGVAPGARWIGCRNMEQGYGSPATYIECYEWFIAPYPPGGDPMTDGDPAMAPHVINNSWSCPASEGCTDPNILREVVETVRAAGIVTVQAASNSGPACSSVRTPAAIYDASLTVGSTDSTDTIAGSSARGPVITGDNAPAKPDVSAPGVSVRSAALGGDYRNSSGTSMAAPHVAGQIALLISAAPQLAGNADQLESLVTTSAFPHTSGQGCGGDGPDSVPNHVYGWGRIDALASYLAIVSPPPTTPTPSPAPSPTPSPVPSPTTSPATPSPVPSAMPSASPTPELAHDYFIPLWMSDQSR